MPQLQSSSRWSTRARKQAGVTLIEVLVAVVILSFGVLSVVALQLVSKRNNVDAAAQSLAAQLSYDIIERMRMNNTTAALSQYITTATAGIGRAQQGTTEPTPHCDSIANTCNATQMAIHDVWAFEQQLDGNSETVGGAAVGGLVNPTACVTGPGTGVSGTYVVTVAWRSKIPLPVSGDACGAGLGIYGTAAECQAATGNGAATADCFRRTLPVSAYIINPPA